MAARLFIFLLLLWTSVTVLVVDSTNVTAKIMSLYTPNGNTMVPGATGVTLNTEHPTFIPWARKQHCVAYDPVAGHFYVFGGRSVNGFLADLWRFNYATQLWSWRGGANGDYDAGTPAYGQIGQLSASAAPGGLASHSCAITSGSLYVFGGWGVTVEQPAVGKLLNDLWKFDLVAAQWAWMGGNSSSTMGVSAGVGVETSQSMPGRRYNHVLTAHQSQSQLFLSGGMGHPANVELDATNQTTGRPLNDVWRFSAVSGMWTLLYGTAPDLKAAYGTVNVANTANRPGGRYGHTVVLDTSANNMWMFAGTGNDNIGVLGLLNDVWRFNFAAGSWTWMGGSRQANSPGAYSGLAPQPGGRAFMCMTNVNGRLITFGGLGMTNDSSLAAGMNDFWSFDTQLLRWSFLAGSHIQRLYGTVNSTTRLGYPRSRFQYAAATTSASGAVTMFGGLMNTEADELNNDLWQFDVVFDADLATTLANSVTTTTVASSSVNPSPTSSVDQPVASSTTTIGFSALVSSTSPIAASLELPSSSVSSLLTNEASSSSRLLVESTSSSYPLSSSAYGASASTIEQSASIISTVPSGKYNVSLTIMNPIVLAETPVEIKNATPTTLVTMLTSADYLMYVIAVACAAVLLAICCVCVICQRRRSRIRRTKSVTESTTVELHTISSTTDLLNDVDVTNEKGSQSKNMMGSVRKAKKGSGGGPISRKSTEATLVGSGRKQKFPSHVPLGSTTYMPDTMEIAIPGYLRMHETIDYKTGRLLSTTKHGKNYRGTLLNTRLMKHGADIFVKVLTDSTGGRSEPSPRFHQELTVMNYLNRHANIVDLIGWCANPASIIMKFYRLGALDQWIQNKRPPVKQLVSFSLDIVRGIEFMHSKDIVHCDLKPANVLVDQEPGTGRYYCVLADFGVAQIFARKVLLVDAFQAVNVQGYSLQYAGPEVLERCRRRMPLLTVEEGFRGDIYSIGMSMYEMLNRVSPWCFN